MSCPKPPYPNIASPRSPTRALLLYAALLGLGALLLGRPAVAQEATTTTPAREETPQPEATVDSDPCLADEQCDQLYEKARVAFKEARYEDAFTAYQEAYKRRQVPWLLLNSGRALQRLGRLDEALDYYYRYKSSDVKATPERIAKANQYIGEVKAAQEEAAQRKAAAAPPVPPPAPEKKPVYKKWWFWTIIGGVVVAGAATGLAVGLTRSNQSAPMQPPIPMGISIYMPMF
jgi:tetratricopeptide (TPR) repeat protein